MPLTASGKIVKRELMRWVEEGRAQSASPSASDNPVSAEG